MKPDLAFYKATLPFESNLFKELSNSIEFEGIANGRVANNLVKVEDGLVPIVRTTSKYHLPAQHFLPIHHIIISAINKSILTHNFGVIPTQEFNHALVEIYDSNYAKMGYHSDQSLDLVDNSFIGLFSCYEQPDLLSEQNTRKLKIKDKITQETTELLLTHHSAILFSTTTNSKFQHKIVLDIDPRRKIPELENRWLGITFRTSKTHIEFRNNEPFFTNGEPLALANQEQEQAFFKLRTEENRSLHFIYPNLNFTISKADTLLPTKFKR